MYKLLFAIIIFFSSYTITAQASAKLTLTNISILGKFILKVGDTLTIGKSSSNDQRRVYNYIMDDERYFKFIKDLNQGKTKAIVASIYISNTIEIGSVYYFACRSLFSKAGDGPDLIIDIENAVKNEEVIAVNSTLLNIVYEQKKIKNLQKQSAVLSGEQIVSLLDPAVVTILTDNGKGSGVILSSDGYIITNSHVIGETKKIMIYNRYFESQLSAKVIFRDVSRDILICKIDATGLTSAVIPVTINNIFTGMEVYAIGSPIDYFNLITKGIISGVLIEGYYQYIIHDASIGSGNSGGALINTKGELIGINVGAVAPHEGLIVQNINYAIPINDILEILKERNLLYIFNKPK